MDDIVTYLDSLRNAAQQFSRRSQRASGGDKVKVREMSDEDSIKRAAAARCRSAARASHASRDGFAPLAAVQSRHRAQRPGRPGARRSRLRLSSLRRVRKDASYNSWVSLGPANAFPEGETRLATSAIPSTSPWDGADRQRGLLGPPRGRHQFQVFAINCAHLGCPVRWFPQSQLFLCPCHGGVYYADGSRASGPPERGLFNYHYKIVRTTAQIDAGQMPTLSNTAKLVNIVRQRQGDSSCRG